MLIPVNGIQVNVERAGAGPPLLLLHGFTGAVTTWAPFQPLLTRHRQTIAVDLIGHGSSDSPGNLDRYRMDRCVADFLAMLDYLEIGQFDLLGYSMGARVALHLAVAAPERVRKLILESGSPGLADPAERQARVTTDAALAEIIERDGLESFVDRWERLPLFTSQDRLSAEARAALRTQRLKNQPKGLANSLRGMGTGQMEPLWDRLSDLSMPTLLLAGALDAKYVRLAQRMGALIPTASVTVVPEAGHAIHLEQPSVFGATVVEFLAEWET